MEKAFKRKVAMYEFELKDLTKKIEEERAFFEKDHDLTKKELKKNTEFMKMYKEKLEREI